jgi:hypothetical protein
MLGITSQTMSKGLWGHPHMRQTHVCCHICQDAVEKSCTKDQHAAWGYLGLKTEGEALQRHPLTPYSKPLHVTQKIEEGNDWAMSNPMSKGCRNSMARHSVSMRAWGNENYQADGGPKPICSNQLQAACGPRASPSTGTLSNKISLTHALTCGILWR